MYYKEVLFFLVAKILLCKVRAISLNKTIKLSKFFKLNLFEVLATKFINKSK